MDAQVTATGCLVALVLLAGCGPSASHPEVARVAADSVRFAADYQQAVADPTPERMQALLAYMDRSDIPYTPPGSERGSSARDMVQNLLRMQSSISYPLLFGHLDRLRSQWPDSGPCPEALAREVQPVLRFVLDLVTGSRFFQGKVPDVIVTLPFVTPAGSSQFEVGYTFAIASQPVSSPLVLDKATLGRLVDCLRASLLAGGERMAKEAIR